jgi:hypothetical protein
MIEPPLVVSITLLSLADHAGKFFDWVDVRRRLGRFDEVLVVPLAPAAQPLQLNEVLVSGCGI